MQAKAVDRDALRRVEEEAKSIKAALDTKLSLEEHSKTLASKMDAVGLECCL